MLQLALQGTDFVIDKRELNREGRSYMIDTLISMRKDYPSESLALILGLDAFAGLSSWYRWQELLEYSHIIVCSRPQHSRIDDDKDINGVVDRCAVDDADLLQQYQQGKIYFQPVTQLAISSTQIREICKRGESPRFLMPTEVSNYIDQHNLYQ
jgi:nicotinate-nucleotide adenylyltransferase